MWKWRVQVLGLHSCAEILQCMNTNRIRRSKPGFLAKSSLSLCVMENICKDFWNSIKIVRNCKKDKLKQQSSQVGQNLCIKQSSVITCRHKIITNYFFFGGGGEGGNKTIFFGGGGGKQNKTKQKFEYLPISVIKKVAIA